jgi:hypothetical protein
MKTPIRTICRPVPLCISLAAVAIAAAGAASGVNRPSPLDARLHIYPYEAPFGPADGVGGQANPLAARLHIFPYEAPFGPDASPVLARRPAEQ